MKVSIIGPTGYTGRELIGLLLKHPRVEEVRLFGRRHVLIHQEFPEFLKVFEREVQDIDPEKITTDTDVVFIALPHKISMEITPGLRAVNKGVRIIDLSADYRLQDIDVYKKAYGVDHKDPDHVKSYVYGLCESMREEIAHAQFIANPGCYPTGIEIPLLPLLEKGMVEGTVIADSKSGASGAGKGLSQQLHFVECNENIVPYKIFRHQHAPEIRQFLKGFSKNLGLIFTPHLLPVERGILSVLYVKLTKKIEQEDLTVLFEERFHNEPFVRVLPEGDVPNLLRVKKTNFCDIGLFVDKSQEYIVIVSAIDNLVKGAAGSAVQNMNIMLGFDEKEGLI